MYGVIRRYNVQEGMTHRMVKRVNESFAPLVSSLPGFISYYLINGGDGTVTAISIFDSRDHAEESNRVASEWVRDNIRAMVKTAPVIVGGEVGAHAMGTALR